MPPARPPRSLLRTRRSRTPSTPTPAAATSRPHPATRPPTLPRSSRSSPPPRSSCPQKAAYIDDKGVMDNTAYGTELAADLHDLNVGLDLHLDRPDRRFPQDHRLRQGAHRHRPLQVGQLRRRPVDRARSVRRLLRQQGRSGQGVHPDHQGLRDRFRRPPEGRGQLAVRRDLRLDFQDRRRHQPQGCPVPGLRLLPHRVQRPTREDLLGQEPSRRVHPVHRPRQDR